MPFPARVWSCWVSTLTQLDTTSSGVNLNPCCCFMQHLATVNMPADVYCHFRDFAGCHQRVLHIQIQVTGNRNVYSPELTLHGEILSSLYPWQEWPFANHFALNEGVEENLHTVSRGRLTSYAYQYFFVCSLQIQLWFLPVTQIPQLYIAVASVGRGNCL